MLEDDIQYLAGRKFGVSLERLENDVWQGIDAQARLSQAANIVGAWQAAIVALVLFTGVAGGAYVGRLQAATEANHDVVSPGAGRAPSTLLLGARL